MLFSANLIIRTKNTYQFIQGLNITQEKTSSLTLLENGLSQIFPYQKDFSHKKEKEISETFQILIEEAGRFEGQINQKKTMYGVTRNGDREASNMSDKVIILKGTFQYLGSKVNWKNNMKQISLIERIKSAKRCFMML